MAQNPSLSWPNLSGVYGANTWIDKFLGIEDLGTNLDLILSTRGLAPIGKYYGPGCPFSVLRDIRAAILYIISEVYAGYFTFNDFLNILVYRELDVDAGRIGLAEIGGDGYPKQITDEWIYTAYLLTDFLSYTGRWIYVDTPLGSYWFLETRDSSRTRGVKITYSHHGYPYQNIHLAGEYRTDGYACKINATPESYDHTIYGYKYPLYYGLPVFGGYNDIPGTYNFSDQFFIV